MIASMTSERVPSLMLGSERMYWAAIKSPFNSMPLHMSQLHSRVELRPALATTSRLETTTSCADIRRTRMKQKDGSMSTAERIVEDECRRDLCPFCRSLVRKRKIFWAVRSAHCILTIQSCLV